MSAIILTLAALVNTTATAPAPAIVAAPKPAAKAPAKAPAKPAPSPAAPTPAPAATPAPASAPAAALPVSAAGKVVDAQTGEPVAGVLVQQDGAVTSVFSQADGTFRVLLERGAGGTLTVSGVGYEGVTMPIGTGRDLVARLSPLAGFVPASPMLPTAPMGQSTADTAPLNTGLIFAYRLRQQLTANGGASINGLISNDFRLGLRLRLRPWLFDAEGSHYQTGVDVAGLDRASNPAFRPSTWQAGARVGMLTSLFSPDLELAGQLGYRWTNTVPNNNDVPFTGSNIDWEQTRHALGPVATLAWRPGRGRFHAEASYGYYGVVASGTKTNSPGQAFANQFLSDLRATVGVEVVPGLRVGLGYQNDRWTGSGEDSAHIGSIQLHYTPGGAPKGNEP